MLRIIGGKYRGRWIKGAPKGALTRPILARIKKSLFDILRNRITGSVFLDLYAGTGSVGIEALSRGASWVTFIDSDKRCVHTIKDNLESLHEEQCEVLRLDVMRDLKSRGRAYTLIFIGSPYVAEDKTMLFLTGKTIEIILKERLLASNGLIIAQHHVKEEIPGIDGIACTRQEKYGDSMISFYIWGHSCSSAKAGIT